MLKPKCRICNGDVAPKRPFYCSKECAKKGDAEVQRVKEHKDKSRVWGLEATLEIDEWFAHLHYFGWKCAYCQERPVTSIDHFIPPGHGGGTTANNCVPCCTRCNSVKSISHPDHMPVYPAPPIPPEAMARVRTYLLSSSKST